MSFPEMSWWMGTSRRTREREAAAQYERVHREGILRDEFAQRAHALESQIAQAHAENCRLRAENRALLNSVLGIAGIPPVIVADPPPALIERASADATVPPRSSVGAQHAVPGADACHDVDHSATVPMQERRHPEERSDEGSLFVSPGCLDAQSKRYPSLPLVAQDDGAMADTVEPKGATSPRANLPPNGSAPPSTMPLQNQSTAATPRDSYAANAQKQSLRARRAPHARSDANVIAPIRRRSWHQIYRMLEFESSRRKDQES